MKGYLIFLFFISFYSAAQNRTDVSLFLKSDSVNSLSTISSESGDMFKKLGHHGPAIENEWLGFRIYFDHKAAIDIYSKSNPGLELAKAKWYPTIEQQKNGWGADYYKAGETVGCGGVRLWDGEKVIPLNPVSKRTARVVKEGTVSYMEMLSEGIPYKNRKVDVLVRVTVFTGVRNARVEAFALCDEAVQFVTGLNYHKGQEEVHNDNYIAVWGLHPEDVAAEKVEVGAAIIFNPESIEKRFNNGNQNLIVSKPCKYMKHWISSANAREKTLNSMPCFNEFIKDKISKQYYND